MLWSAYHQLSPSWEARLSKKWRPGGSDQNKTAMKVAQVFNLGLGWCIVWKFLKAKRLVSWNCEEMSSFFGDKSQIDISSFDTLCQFTWYPMCSEPKKLVNWSEFAFYVWSRSQPLLQPQDSKWSKYNEIVHFFTREWYHQSVTNQPNFNMYTRHMAHLVFLW